MLMTTTTTTWLLVYGDAENGDGNANGDENDEYDGLKKCEEVCSQEELWWCQEDVLFRILKLHFIHPNNSHIYVIRTTLLIILFQLKKKKHLLLRVTWFFIIFPHFQPSGFHVQMTYIYRRLLYSLWFFAINMLWHYVYLCHIRRISSASTYFPYFA